MDKWANVSDFLSDAIFSDFDIIRLKWQLFGDDDVLKRDTSIPVFKFFKAPKKYWNGRPVQQGKQIVRGHLEKRLQVENHYSFLDGIIQRACNPSGELSLTKNDVIGDLSNAHLNHYMTKTLDEFLNQKVSRGDAMFANRNIDITYFWKLNSRTLEKL